MGTVALSAPLVVGQNVEDVLQFVDSSGKPVSGRARKRIVAFSSSYATGGDTVPMASLGLRNVNKILTEPWETGVFGDAIQSGVTVCLAGTPGAPTLRAFDAVGAEVANATNLSTRQLLVWFIGD